MSHRLFLTATAAAVSLAGFGASPPPALPRTPAAPTAAIGSPASVEVTRTLPCGRFHQVPDGAWILTGSVQAGGANVDSMVYPKGTAEAAILSQRCLP